MQKSTILETLNSFPNDFNLDEFIERLIVIEKIEQGLADEAIGDLIGHEELKKLVTQWKK
jgi:predicted transcriptional regulator